MEQIASDKARKNLRELLDRVMKGETIIITRYGRPEVIMVPPEVWERMQAEKEQLQGMVAEHGKNIYGYVDATTMNRKQRNMLTR